MFVSCFSFFYVNLINLHINSSSPLPACYLLPGPPKFMK
jgi:hypothetical protein